MEPQPISPPVLMKDKIWDALQTGLTVWGAYTLFVQVIQWTRTRKR